MIWRVQYMRYHSPGEYEAESLREAINVAMGYIEDGWAAPTEIRTASGRVVVTDDDLRRLYSEDYGRIATSEAVIRQVKRYRDRRAALNVRRQG